MQTVYVLLTKYVDESGYVAPTVFNDIDVALSYVVDAYPLKGQWRNKIKHGIEVRTADGLCDLVIYEKTVNKQVTDVFKF